MKFVLAACAVALCPPAFASTMTDYSAVVSVIGADKQPVFSGICSAQWGTTGVERSKPVLVVLRCPQYEDSEVLLYPVADLASVRGVPARQLRSKARHTVKLLTAEGETISFTTE